MKKIISVLAWLFMVSIRLSSADGQPPMIGDKLPEFTLKTPAELEFRKYLGVEGDVFSVSSIKAEIVIIQIFSMYCPHCQREAPLVNHLFEMLEKHHQNKIKLIGIGAGNSDYEVSYFRKKYEAQFPLFSDPDFLLHKLFSEVRTPYFFAVHLKKDGSSRIIYSKLGSFGEPNDFIKLILRESEKK